MYSVSNHLVFIYLYVSLQNVSFNPKKLFFSERPDQIRVNHHFDDYHLILSVKGPRPPTSS